MELVEFSGWTDENQEKYIFLKEKASSPAFYNSRGVSCNKI